MGGGSWGGGGGKEGDSRLTENFCYVRNVQCASWSYFAGGGKRIKAAGV